MWDLVLAIEKFGFCDMRFDFDHGKQFESVTIEVMVFWRPIDYQGDIQ